MGTFEITAKTVPECENFLKIQWPQEELVTINELISRHPDATEKEIDDCMVEYRGTTKLHKAFIDDYSGSIIACITIFYEKSYGLSWDRKIFHDEKSLDIGYRF